MPLVKKIRISEAEISAQNAYTQYNEALVSTLATDHDRALLILHPIIPADHFLWEWALDWKNKFLENGKLLSILTSDKQQSDALSGLHLKKVDSPKFNTASQDLEQLFSSLSKEEINTLQIKTSLNTLHENTLRSNDIFVPARQRFEITGEYCCNGCGLSDVFLKGEIAPICNNIDCQGLSEGWNLKVELF